MSPQRATIANLLLKSNLISDDYPSYLPRVSAFELHDIKRRNRLLPFDLDPTSYSGVTPAQRRQWDSRLFWGDRRIALTEARRLRWLEGLAAVILTHTEEIAGRLGAEQAFEVLYVTEQLRRTDSPLSARAAEISARMLRLLRGGAFGYSDAEIEQRLAMIIGDPDFRLEESDAHRPDPDRR
jgi:hypothetical protein